jgi:hypothetical protein
MSSDDNHLDICKGPTGKARSFRLMNKAAIFMTLCGSVLLCSCSKNESGRQNTTEDRSHETQSESQTGKDSAAEQRSAADTRTESEDEELRPSPEEIGEDCVAFVRATKVVGTRPSADCPQCPAGNSFEALKFDSVHVEAISCHERNCEVTVTILATFNSTSGGQELAGGLTGWISPEQRRQLLSGQAGKQQQTFRVEVAYRRDGQGWRAVEFSR